MSDETKKVLLDLSVKKNALEFVKILKGLVPNCAMYLTEMQVVLELLENQRQLIKFNRYNCLENRSDPNNKIFTDKSCIFMFNNLFA